MVVYVLVQVGDEDSLARRETLPVEEELQPRDTVQLAGGTQGRLTVKGRITKENKALKPLVENAYAQVERILSHTDAHVEV